MSRASQAKPAVPAISTADKVTFLSRPQAYSHRPLSVLVEETHMSWVFLAGELVYKLKKPVSYAFLDFSTIGLREFSCREEVRLNRRLAPDVYRGVVPLVFAADGKLALGGPGMVVDWLVEMRRLPAEWMLDNAILQGTVTRRAVTAVSGCLTNFYRCASPSDVTADEHLALLAREHRLTKSILVNRAFALDQEKVRRALALVDDGLANTLTGPAARAAGKRIIEGHGDLRPEHVCLKDPPAIIDCVEFNRRLRLVDPIDEITFLGLECARLGARWIGTMILRDYLEHSGDHAPGELIQFYWAYRACLRARLSLVHIIEHDKRKPEKWLPLARQYLDLACSRPINPAVRGDRKSNHPLPTS
jgi:aminoglycoside phosphotransferase family enzyme